MHCPLCDQVLEAGSSRCPACGYDHARPTWVVLKTVSPPDDIIIESLLRAHGIPCLLRRKEVAQIPVVIGPFADVEIRVPDSVAEAARSLVETEFSGVTGQDGVDLAPETGEPVE